MRYIVFTFSYIFFSVKKVFSVEKIFDRKLFFYIKTFFCANNVYFVKNTNIFSKKKGFFFNLVLQQMNNHSHQGFCPNASFFQDGGCKTRRIIEYFSKET